MYELPENISTWIQELRSGEHSQTRGTLKRNLGDSSVGYCCLGVYVEKVKGFSVRSVARTNNHEGATKWYDLCDTDLGINLKDNVAVMNDGGYTFDEIADYIEKYYKDRADA